MWNGISGGPVESGSRPNRAYMSPRQNRIQLNMALKQRMEVEPLLAQTLTAGFRTKESRTIIVMCMKHIDLMIMEHLLMCDSVGEASGLIETLLAQRMLLEFQLSWASVEGDSRESDNVPVPNGLHDFPQDPIPAAPQPVEQPAEEPELPA